MPDKKSPNPALTKAFEKAEGDGPIETTLELTEAQIKKLIRAADRVILDAADTAKKVPAVALDAAKAIADYGVDSLKGLGLGASTGVSNLSKGIFGAIKALGSFVGTDFAPGSLMGPKPKGDTSPPSMAPFPRPVKPSFPPYVNPDRIPTAVPKEEMPKKPLPRKKSPSVNPDRKKSPTVNPDRIDKAKPKNKYSDIDKYF